MTLAQRLDGWMNPIMVKELRQAVRGRFIVTVLTLSLLAQIIAVGAFMLSDLISTTPGRDPVGDSTFTALFFVLFTATVLFVPLYSGVRMAIERSDTNVDLLFVTTIKPRTIVLGKLFTTIALTALMFCASLPFLVFSYVLRGIDVVTILFVCFIAFFVVCSSAVLALFLGCIPATKPFRLLLAVVFFGLTIIGYSGFAVAIATIIRNTTTAMFLTSDFWIGLTLSMITIGAVDAMLLVATTVVIAPPAANRAFPIRTMIACAWTLSGTAAAYSAFRYKDPGPMLVWAMVQLGLITLVLCSAVGEREHWGPRIARTIPANPLKRVLAFLFYSGSAGGVLWAICFFTLTCVAYHLVIELRPPGLVSQKVIGTHVLIEAAMCFLAYLLSAMLLRRRFFRRIPSRATWAIGLVIFALAAVIPPLVFLAGYSGTPELKKHYNLVTILNPFPMLDGDMHPARLPALLIWLVPVLVLTLPRIREQWRAFHPLRASDDDASLEELQEGTAA